MNASTRVYDDLEGGSVSGSPSSIGTRKACSPNLKIDSLSERSMFDTKYLFAGMPVTFKV
jgi:hypothetical protein